MSNTQPSRESLSQFVAEHVGADPSEVQLRPCPTGKRNQTYFVDVADQSLVLRVAPPDDPTQISRVCRRASLLCILRRASHK
jgi:aminoglycoside phosphotransferase (APT) family kinase protein